MLQLLEMFCTNSVNRNSIQVPECAASVNALVKCTRKKRKLHTEEKLKRGWAQKNETNGLRGGERERARLEFGSLEKV